MNDRASTPHTPDSTQPVPRSTMSIEPAIAMRSTAFDWDYEVQVALPASYGSNPEKQYPVLWLTDGPQLLHLAVGLMNTLTISGLAPELIIVGVGCAGEEGWAEAGRRRLIDLWPPGETPFFEGPGGDVLRKLMLLEEDAPRQADDLLDFLVDDVRPALQRDYRMEDDHGLFGHSAGGGFTNYALFARPGAFRRYIIGSPSSNASDRAAFRLEADYAAAHTDLQADVFFGAGEQETGQPHLAAFGLLSSALLMAETLLVRQYPSLTVVTRIFPGKGHHSVMADILSEGIRAVWADKAEPAYPAGM